MSWIVAMATALVALGAIVLLRRRASGGSRQGIEAVGAALLLGIAGYGMQASPGLPGAPKAPAESISGDAQAMVEARKGLDAPGTPAGSSWLVIADGMARHGRYADASAVLLGALDDNPRDAEAWLALGNALVGHADGLLTPAALYAYQHAAEAAPDHPGPPFFLGLALAQSGRLAEGRALWADLLARSPADAPWREDLKARLAQLDAFIARQTAASAGQ